MQLDFSRRNVVRPAVQKARRHPARRSPARRGLSFDCLEDRRLLSAGTLTTPPAWTVAPVSGETAAQQTGTVQNSTSSRSVAMFGDGSSVVTWADVKSGGITYNLMFQEYSASGAPLGPATTVAAGNNLPSIMVAAQQTNSPGKFVITWTTNITPHNGHNYPVTHAQVWQFGSTPTLQASTTIGTSKAGFSAASLAMDASGNFDLATDGLSVQRFTSAAVAQGSIINVASAVQPVDWGPATVAIAMDARGDFALSWPNMVSNGTWANYVSYINAEKFILNSSGTPVGQGVIPVAQVGPLSGQTSEHLAQANIGMDLAGDFVVSWRDAPMDSTIINGTVAGSVYARVFYAGGGTTGAIDEVPITIGQIPNGTAATNFAVQDVIPAVVAHPSGGGAFDLAWTGVSVNNNTGTWAGYHNVYAEQFDSSGAASSQGPITAYQSQPNAGGFRFPSAAVDANNDLMVVYSLDPQEAPPAGFTSANGNVFAQFYVDPPAPATTTSSPTGAASTSGSSASASAALTDAAFASYAYPEEDDVLR